MCLVAFFLSLLFAELLRNFLSSPWPDHCWLFSLLKEKNTPLVHAAKFKTRDLLSPSTLCSLVNKPLCFIALSWIFRVLCKWFSSSLCCVSFLFSLYLIRGSEWTPITKFPKTSIYPQPLHLCHIDTWRFYVESFLLLSAFLFLFLTSFRFFPSATALESNNHCFPKIKFIFLCCKFRVKSVKIRVG